MNVRLLASAAVAIGLASPALAQEKTDTCTGPRDACQELASVPQRYDAAFNKGDPSALAAVFTKDGVFVSPLGPIVHGTEGLKAYYTSAFKAGFSGHRVTVDTARVTGDIAWAVGQWSAVGPGPNNASRPWHGDWGGVFVREGGTWKIQMLSPNTIETPPGGASTASTNR